MPLSETVVNAAALSGRLSILQQLLSEQQCPRPTNLSHFAAHRGSINMLDWLRNRLGGRLGSIRAQELHQEVILQYCSVSAGRAVIGIRSL